jgi:hypothetical protein
MLTNIDGSVMADAMDAKGMACQQCGDLFDPHVMVPTSEDPRDGGIILCPVKGCQCYATWDAGSGRPEVRIPSNHEITKLRENVQAGRPSHG